ncbi:MAG: hypothetical protein ACRDQ1_20335 [Sciscionella sp.]
MLDNGLSLAGSAVAHGVGADQANVLLGRIFSGGLSAVGVISGIGDIGILLLGIAMVRAGVPHWGSAAIVAGAIARIIGFGSGNRYVAAAGFALLAIGFVTVARTRTAGEPAPPPAVIATTAA